MEITKAPNQISEIIQQRKTFLGTKTAKNKDSHFSAQDFAPSPCSHSEPGMQLWTTAKERLSIPKFSANHPQSNHFKRKTFLFPPSNIFYMVVFAVDREFLVSFTEYFNITCFQSPQIPSSWFYKMALCQGNKNFKQSS